MRLWKWLNKLSSKKIKDNYLKEHGCDSCCPRCKRWESESNTIYTEVSEPDDGTEKRTCTNCDYVWKTIFTPAGFIPVDQCTTAKVEDTIKSSMNLE